MKILQTFIIVSIILIFSCSIVKPAVKSINDLSKELCSIFFSEKMAISPVDAAKLYCDTQEKLEPFIEEVLKAKKIAGEKAHVKSK